MREWRNNFEWLEREIPGEFPVYGIRYNILSKGYNCERIMQAKGLSADISVDNDSINNDFDNIYPWSDMKICNVLETETETIITYQDEQDFSLDGSNGDVMVEIPKHYIKRYREGGYEYLLISPTPKEGFSLDPSFLENGVELDKIYVGRYNNCVENSNLYSKTNTYPAGYTGLFSLLDKAEEKGTGYSILDFRTLSTIQRLFLVEFATLNSQAVMGGVTKTVYWQKADCLALHSETQSNSIIIQQGFQSDKFKVDQRCSVGDEPEYQDRHITEINDLPNDEREIKFDGDPVDIVEGETYIYNTPVENGRTDYIQYSSGRESGDNDKVSFSYRGIENIYGNIHEIIAGIFIKDGVPYIFDNINDYRNTDFSNSQTINFSLPAIPFTGDYDATTPYIKEMGYDEQNPLYLLPIEAGVNTVGQDYWCDEINAPQETSDTFYCAFGGGWDHYERSGLFNYRFFLDVNSSDPGWLNGSRLIYKLTQ